MDGDLIFFGPLGLHHRACLKDGEGIVGDEKRTSGSR